MSPSAPLSASEPLSPAVRAYLEQARVGRMATADAAGVPAVVPICYQVEGARLYTPLDAKPKAGDWRRLQRVRNLRANPALAVVVDRWAEDWARLAWVHLRGTATVVEQGPLQERGAALLTAKYPQYEALPLAGQPMIVMEIASARHWGDLTAGGADSPAAPGVADA